MAETNNNNNNNNKLINLEKKLKELENDSDYDDIFKQKENKKENKNYEKTPIENLFSDKSIADIYSNQNNFNIEKKIKPLLDQEQKLRLIANRDIMSLSEIIKGSIQYMLGRPINAPTMIEAGKRHHKKIEELYERISVSDIKLKKNSSELNQYLIKTLESLWHNHQAYVESKKKMQKYASDSKELQYALINIKDLNGNAIEAFKKYLLISEKEKNEAIKSIKHITIRDINHSELNATKEIQNMLEPIQFYIARVGGHLEFLGKHMIQMLKTYDCLTESTRNVNNVQEYIKKATNTLVAYRSIAEQIKNAFVNQNKVGFSDESTALYKEFDGR